MLKSWSCCCCGKLVPLLFSLVAQASFSLFKADGEDDDKIGLASLPEFSFPLPGVLWKFHKKRCAVKRYALCTNWWRIMSKNRPTGYNAVIPRKNALNPDFTRKNSAGTGLHKVLFPFASHITSKHSPHFVPTESNFLPTFSHLCRLFLVYLAWWQGYAFCQHLQSCPIGMHQLLT